MKKLLSFSLITLLSTSACKRSNPDQDTVKTSYVHRYGVEMPNEAEWQERGSTGEVVKKQKNGVTVRENYVEGTLHGKKVETYAHRETPEKASIYSNGSLIEQVLYYTSGAPQQKNVFDKNNTIFITYWYEDGTPRAEEVYQDAKLVEGKYFTPNNELEAAVKIGSGARVTRDSTGAIVTKDAISDGTLSLQVTYHPNGTPAAKTPYVNGQIHGERHTFFAGGEPKTFEKWENDKLNGITILYENGEKIATVPYSQGLKQGIEKRYKAGTSDIVEEISWYKDMRRGPSTSYIDGVKITDWYFNNKKVTKHQYQELASQ
jgi:antitoxin component YwqK of YwqJK toxin-antitoxin module